MIRRDAHNIHISLNDFNELFEGAAKGYGKGFSGCPGKLWQTSITMSNGLG
jgi:hypothetical protein